VVQKYGNVKWMRTKDKDSGCGIANIVMKMKLVFFSSSFAWLRSISKDHSKNL
jgi:hypothetical protein